MECSICHCIDEKNRLNQSAFKCTSCGHEENADTNASKIIKHRGIELIKNFDINSYQPKSKKTIKITRKNSKVGQELSKPTLEIELKACGENVRLFKNSFEF